MDTSMQNNEQTELYGRSVEALRVMLDHTDAGILILDYYTGEILMCNHIYANAFDMSCDKMNGRICYRNLGCKSRCSECPHDKLLDENGQPRQQPVTVEVFFKKAEVWLQASHRAMRWLDGRLVQMVSFVDITNRHRKEENLNTLAYRDKATMLPNPARMEHDLVQDPHYQYLIVVDIEGLRKINTLYGRASGDALLKLVRDFISELNIPDSILYRQRIGDFGILIRKMDGGLEAVQKIVNKLRGRFNSEWSLTLGSYSHTLFTSVTICVVPALEGGSTSFSALYGAVEHTLDVARNAGGVAIYGDDLHRTYHKKIALEISLKKSVHDGMTGFSLAFQPIVEPGLAIWSGMEALCRWESEEFGVVSPAEFIPIAEACGLIDKIGLWILEQSIAQVKRWRLDRLDKFLLDVNLSPFQLSLPELDLIIIEMLKKYEYPPQKLCLEVTESSDINFNHHTLEAVRRLNDIGVVIALDDFGTGFASLSVLHRLPVKVLKTDRSFLSDMENDQKLQYLFHVIIELAHNANMKIVAEGVETEAQARFLLKQGADYFQGYYFSKPLSPAQIGDMLANFSTPSKTLVDIGYDKVDLVKTSDGHLYDLTPGLYRLLFGCIRELYSNPDANAAIRNALCQIGQDLAVSHAYVILKGGGGRFAITHEWRAPGIPNGGHSDVDLAVCCPALMDSLKKEGLLLAFDAHRCDENLSAFLSSPPIRSLAVFPIWRDDCLFGLVGISDCAETRRWTPEEVQMLHILAGIITATLTKMWMQQELHNQHLQNEVILNNLDTAVKVIDPASYEVLYINSGIKRRYDNQDLVGRICWEALEHRTSRCGHCPIPLLEKHPDTVLQWEHYCAAIGRHLKIRSGLIPWTDGRTALLEYSEDITELKNSQNRLEIIASTDMLTNVLNRNALLDAAARAFVQAETDKTPVTVAFIDIDRLKTVNDLLGHAAGDELILNVVKSLRRFVCGSDILGRYGGDEFIAVLPHCDRQKALDKMRSACLYLKEICETQRMASSFSYGLAENRETDAPTADERLRAVIDLADQRMLAYKQKHAHAYEFTE